MPTSDQKQSGLGNEVCPVAERADSYLVPFLQHATGGNAAFDG